MIYSLWFFFLSCSSLKKIHQCYIKYIKLICTNNIEQLAVICRTWLSSLPLRDLPATWLVGSWSGACRTIGQNLVTLKVIHSSYNGFAEETFFFLHHLVTDAGSAGFMSTRSKHSRDWVGIAYSTKVLFFYNLWCLLEAGLFLLQKADQISDTLDFCLTDFITCLEVEGLFFVLPALWYTARGGLGEGDPQGKLQGRDLEGGVWQETG